MNLDKDYEDAIRCYLDYALNTGKNKVSFAEMPEMNSEKALTRYIKAKAPINFKFSTPMFAWWDLTSACNFRCIHCLYNASPYDDSNDLNDEEVYALADSLINNFRVTQVALTGGEVFLRPHTLMNVISRFKEDNVAILLATNAALINDSHIDFLASNLNYYTDRIQVSLDGATFEMYKKIRQTDLFDKVIANIRKMTEKGLRITVVITANSVNYEEIVDTYKLADELGASEFAVTKMLYFNESHVPLMLNTREKIILAEKLIKESEFRKTRLQMSLFTPIEIINDKDIIKILNTEKYLNLFKDVPVIPARSCNSDDRISIRSDGRVYMCMEAECPAGYMGNVREQSLLDIWKKRNENIFFQQRTAVDVGCGDCVFNKYCNSGCMVRAYKRTGMLNTPEIKCQFCKNKS